MISGSRLRLPLDLEPRTAAEPIGLVDTPAVHADPAGLGDLGGEGAREAEHLREGGVHPHSVEPVRDGKAARVHDQSVCCAGAAGSISGSASAVLLGRVPSRCGPASTRRATAIIIDTMKMSATL